MKIELNIKYDDDIPMEIMSDIFKDLINPYSVGIELNFNVIKQIKQYYKNLGFKKIKVNTINGKVNAERSGVKFKNLWVSELTMNE